MARERPTPGAEVAQDLGLAAILGGNLFARLGMHPALAEVSDARERGKVVNAAWSRYGAINGIGLAALVAGWWVSRDDPRSLRSGRDRRLAVARDVTVGAVAASGLAAAVEGMRFSRMEPEGAVPLEDGDEASRDASPPARAAKSRLTLLGGFNLASALALAALNAVLRRAA